MINTHVGIYNCKFNSHGIPSYISDLKGTCWKTFGSAKPSREHCISVALANFLVINGIHEFNLSTMYRGISEHSKYRQHCLWHHWWINYLYSSKQVLKFSRDHRILFSHCKHSFPQMSAVSLVISQRESNICEVKYPSWEKK